MEDTDSKLYLKNHNVLTYVEDAISQLLVYKDDYPKVNVKKFLAEYFTCVRDGNHTMFREYEFICSTHHNRASFVRAFWKCFRYIGRRGDILSLTEYHSLVTLLCPDFPLDVILKAGRIVLFDDALDCMISFSDFLYAFQVQFIYSEFCERCRQVYDSLLTGNSRSPMVVVPSSEAARRPASELSGDGDVPAREGANDACDAQAFLRSLQNLCERAEFSVPNFSLIKTIFNDHATLTFYGFLMGLSKSDEFSQSIGYIPGQDQLIFGEIGEDVEADFGASSKRCRSAKSPRVDSKLHPKKASLLSRPSTASRVNPTASTSSIVPSAATASTSSVASGDTSKSQRTSSKRRSQSGGGKTGKSSGRRSGGSRSARAGGSAGGQDDDEDEDEDEDGSSLESQGNDSESNSSTDTGTN